jgi:hypothetical protein
MPAALDLEPCRPQEQIVQALDGRRAILTPECIDPLSGLRVQIRHHTHRRESSGALKRRDLD